MSMNHATVVGKGLFTSEGNPPYTLNLDRSDGYWIIPYHPEYEDEIEEYLSKHFTLLPEFDMTQKGKIKKSNLSLDQFSQEEDQNFPMEFFDELDAVFNKWLLPRGEEIPKQLFTICYAYLRSHGWSLRVGHYHP